MQLFRLNPLIFATPKGNYLFIDDGAVAQLVEQRTENPCVAGSIPAHTTEASTCVGAFLFIEYLSIKRPFF